MTNSAQAERRELADLLDRLGPDAPTLCTGWTTADLVAHLVVREGDLLAAAGIMIGPLSHHTRSAMQGLIERIGYQGLVDRFRNGPPRLSPFRLDPLDAAANTMEFFVHHEDVRRAQPDWEPRELPDEFERLLWGRVTGPGRLMFRRCAVGLLVARPDGATVRVRKGEPTAVLSGKPSELVLYMTGRKSVAQVEITGAEKAIEAVTQAPFGI
ncbi:MAG TPA: TIGR03085 family metal-binding protein [Actinopolymorphaceae bacterium]